MKSLFLLIIIPSIEINQKNMKISEFDAKEDYFEYNNSVDSLVEKCLSQYVEGRDIV